MAEIKRSLAVVIGIDQYSNGIPALQTPVNDAQEIAATLESKYEYQVVLMLDGDANSDKFNSLLTAFEQHKLLLSNGSQIEIEETDRLFFYFAGHGIAKDNLENADGPGSFLIPQDARMDNKNTFLSKLLNWKKQELGPLVLQTELRPIANKWATQKHEKKAVGLLWDDDPRLPLVHQLLKSDVNWLNLTELEFVKRSIQKRRNKQLNAIAMVSAVMILLSQLTAFGFIQLRFSIVNNNVEEIRRIPLVSNWQSTYQSICPQLHNNIMQIPQIPQANIAEDR